MRRLISYFLSVTAVILALTSCDDWTDMKTLYGEEPENTNPESYYEALRAYKASDHVRCFGWYDGWMGIGTTAKGYLSALPDSMDLVSIWHPVESYAEPLTEAQKTDLERVHKKGIKVLFCLFFKDIGFRMTPGIEAAEPNNPSEEYKGKMRETWGWYERDYDSTPEADTAICRYAQALADYVIENGYDGIDFDFERNYGERGNLVESNAALHVFLTELSHYFGPKSGTDRVLAVDGEPQTLAPESGPLLSYYIIQAYYCGGDAVLDGRFLNLKSTFSSVEDEATILKKLIWTEDFERYSDGKNMFTYRDGHKNPGSGGEGSTPYSIEGMAHYYRDIDGEVVKVGGFGAYRFNLSAWENDYALYRWLIQGINPAPPQQGE